MSKFLISYTTETFDGIINHGQFTVEFRDEVQAKSNALSMVIGELEENMDVEDESWMDNIETIRVSCNDWGI